MDKLIYLKQYLIFMIVSVITGLTLNQCDHVENGYPIEQNLDEVHISQIKEVDNHLYAATNDGVYRTDLRDFNGKWENLGLKGHFISSIVKTPEGALLAGLRQTAEEDVPPLFLSNRNHTRFDPYPQNYAGDREDAIVYTMMQDPYRPDTIYARGAYFAARSPDAGESWELIFGDWGSAGYQADIIKVHPLEPETIWVGGETTIFQPYLTYSEDLGENWEGIELDTGGDDAAYSLAFHPDDPDEILLGMEGKIKHTEDRGQNWEWVFENDLYHYIHVMESPGDKPSETVYASGTENGAAGGGLFFLKTEDFGESWDKTRADLDIDGMSINDLLIREESGARVIYFATSQGVWQYDGEQFSRPGED